MSLAAAGDDPIVGRWSGEITEQDPGGTSKYTYTIQFDSPSHGTTNYPSYHCTGELSGSRAADNTYSYTEKINDGDCDGGHLELKLVNHNTISMVWSPVTGTKDDTASGTLTRQ